MGKEWEEISRDEAPSRWAGLYATINRQGQIFITKTTYRALGAPEAVNLLYDRANRIIGLKPTVAAMRNAYKIGPRGRYGGKVIRAYTLLAKCRIDMRYTLRFTSPEIDDDGILNLYLRKTVPVGKYKM